MSTQSGNGDSMSEEKQAIVGFCFVTLLVVVGLSIFCVLRLFAAEPLGWPSLAAILVIAASVCLAGKGLSNPLWGLALALLLPFHPYLRSSAENNAVFVWVEALALASLVGLLAGWHVVFRKSVLPIAWIVVGVATLAATCIAWLLQPSTGLVIGGFLVLGFLIATSLGFAKKRANQLSIWNILFAALLAIVPIGGLILAPVISPWINLGPEGLGDNITVNRLLNSAIQTSADSAVFKAENMHRWAWPLAWAMIPLMAYGFYRTTRRGWQQWSKKSVPSAWGLTLFGVAIVAQTFLNPKIIRTMEYLPWVTLAMMLAVFGLTDWLVGIGERLRLGPPTSVPRSNV